MREQEEEYDPVTSDQLEEQLTALMAKSGARPSQVILAMLGAAAAKIAQIECPNCRTIAAGPAIAAFPSIMADALKFASGRGTCRYIVEKKYYFLFFQTTGGRRIFEFILPEDRRGRNQKR